MCFTATASFVAGIALSVLGVFTLRATRRKVEVPFASIPLMFGRRIPVRWLGGAT